MLKTPANQIENEAAGENGTGEQEEQKKETSSRNHASSHPGRTKTHQNTLEHIKNTCSIMRGPTEALESQNCNTKSSTESKGTPEPSRTEDYSHFGSPATGSRTQEPFRFPGWRPLNLRYMCVCVPFASQRLDQLVHRCFVFTRVTRPAISYSKSRRWQAL